MKNKINININSNSNPTEIIEVYHSNNSELRIHNNHIEFHKKGNNHLLHNEFGPAHISKYKKEIFYAYCINDKYHRLNKPAFHPKYNINNTNSHWWTIGKYAGKTKEEFIKNLPNILIPKK